MASPAEIAQAVVNAFGERSDRISPTDVEKVMRQFGCISESTEHQVRQLLHQAGKADLDMEIGPWIEANFVVSGEGPDKERKIRFLLMDTCTCVLDHLKNAIAHAQGPVDSRILNLLQHKHFRES